MLPQAFIEPARLQATTLPCPPLYGALGLGLPSRAWLSGAHLLVQLWLSAFARIALLSAAAGVLVARRAVLLLATALGLSMQCMAIQTLAQPAKVRSFLLLPYQ